MGPESQRLSATERSNLVAYLDGELNEAETRALATKLTLSISARREVEALERTWELLDYLPRPRASAELSTRTLTIAQQLDARGGLFASAAAQGARQAARVLVGVAVALVGLGLGYAATRWAWPDPTARLARNLSLSEHLDEYRDAESFDFLRQLDESPAFGADD